MQDLGSLQKAAQRQHDDAETKRQLAESTLQKAEQYEKIGDMSHAEAERSIAEKLNQEAERKDALSAQYQVDVIRRKRKIESIDKELDQLNKEHQKKVDKLEREKQNLSGSIL